MWLSRLKPELCTGKQVAYCFGAINFLAYFHKIQPKQTQHVLASNSSGFNLLSHICMHMYNMYALIHNTMV